MCFEISRGKDAKRHSLLRFELFRKIEKFLSLNLRNILISPLEGEKKFLSELCELRNFREGYKKYKTLDRATHNFNLTINYLFHFPCAMTCLLIYPTFVIADFVPRSVVNRIRKYPFSYFSPPRNQRFRSSLKGRT